DALDDRVVLGHRPTDLIDQRAGVEADVSLGLRFDRVVQRAQPRARADLDVAPVKRHVHLEDAERIRVPRSRRLGEFDVDVAELGDQRIAGVVRRFSGAARSKALDRADDLEQFARVLFGQGRDDEALFLFPSDAGDVAFLLEAVQRAAYGCAAHAQPFRDVAFDDARTGCEATGDDEIAELFVCAGDAVAARRPSRYGLMRPGGFHGLGHGAQGTRRPEIGKARTGSIGTGLYTLRYTFWGRPVAY